MAKPENNPPNHCSTQRRFRNAIHGHPQINPRDKKEGALPDPELMAEMSKFNEELIKAGIVLAMDGLQPSSKGARVKFSGKSRTVVDGPFTEAKELYRRLLDLAGQVPRRGHRGALTSEEEAQIAGAHVRKMQAVSLTETKRTFRKLSPIRESYTTCAQAS